MDLLLAGGAAVSTLSLTRFLGYRRAVLTSAALASAAWWWLRSGGHVAGWSALAVGVGAFLGGLAATAHAMGITEDNAPPSPAIRETVLAYHRDLRYPPEPPWKRIFDLTAATAAVALTLPVSLVVAMVIWFEEPGPILFTKNSVGHKGVTFRQFKFRSMRYNAEHRTGPVLPCPDDPRALRVGRWLRRWHLDELPELINVLGGSMSLVGPRPLRTVLVSDYLAAVPGFALRHTVRPGIACTAQIERYRMPPADRLRKDLAYIESMSLAADVTLLWRAVLTTVRGTRDRTEATDCRPAAPWPAGNEPSGVHVESRGVRVDHSTPVGHSTPVDHPTPVDRPNPVNGRHADHGPAGQAVQGPVHPAGRAAANRTP